MAQFISDTVKAVMAACQKLSGKREIELIDEKIQKLNDKKASLSGNVANNGKEKGKVTVNVAKDVTIKKGKMKVTNDELLIDVAANSIVKNICRFIEGKLNRNLDANNKDDFQVLYNHLHKFYSIKHVSSLPIVHGKNKDYHIDDYADIRTNSVINDVTCHIDFKAKK